MYINSSSESSQWDGSIEGSHTFCYLCYLSYLGHCIKVPIKEKEEQFHKQKDPRKKKSKFTYKSLSNDMSRCKLVCSKHSKILHKGPKTQWDNYGHIVSTGAYHMAKVLVWGSKPWLPKCHTNIPRKLFFAKRQNTCCNKMFHLKNNQKTTI